MCNRVDLVQLIFIQVYVANSFKIMSILNPSSICGKKSFLAWIKLSNTIHIYLWLITIPIQLLDQSFRLPVVTIKSKNFIKQIIIKPRTNLVTMCFKVNSFFDIVHSIKKVIEYISIKLGTFFNYSFSLFNLITLWTCTIRCQIIWRIIRWDSSSERVDSLTNHNMLFCQPLGYILWLFNQLFSNFILF